jgi:hypothetical protein
MEGSIMWFNIIKISEKERLKNLGYDVSEVTDIEPKVTRDIIIEDVKTVINNIPAIGPFEGNYKIIRSSGGEINPLNSNALVVEELSDNNLRTNFTNNFTMGYNTEIREFSIEPRTNSDGEALSDSDAGDYIVLLYAANEKTPQIKILINKTIYSYQWLKTFIEDRIGVHSPSFRAGNLFSSNIINNPNVEQLEVGILVTGNSGNKYRVMIKNGDIDVTVIRKKIHIYIKSKRVISSKHINIKLCIHGNRAVPTNDNMFGIVLALINDDRPQLSTIEYVAKDLYINNASSFLENQLVFLSEGGARRGLTLMEAGTKYHRAPF